MAKRAIAVAIAVLAGGCGGSAQTVTVTTRASATVAPSTTTASTTTPSTTTSASPEVLGVPPVGGFYGRCPRGARAWTLQFVVSPTSASETITSRIGRGPLQRSQLNPSQTATFRLIPGTFRAHQAADRMSSHRASTVLTTEPLDMHISQGTEPQFLRLDVYLALTTLGGDTGQCALADSSVTARTYFNGVR